MREPNMRPRSGQGGDAERRRSGVGRRRLLLTWLLSLAALVAAIAALLISGQRTTPSGSAAGAAAAPAGLAVGDQAPDFRLADLQGTQVSLSQYHGKPVILHFWAVDCTTCQAEQPDYIRAIAGLGGKRPTVLAVDAWGESSEKIAGYFGPAHLPGVALVRSLGQRLPECLQGPGHALYLLHRRSGHDPGQRGWGGELRSDRGERQADRRLICCGSRAYAPVGNGAPKQDMWSPGHRLPGLDRAATAAEANRVQKAWMPPSIDTNLPSRRHPAKLGSFLDFLCFWRVIRRSGRASGIVELDREVQLPPMALHCMWI